MGLKDMMCADARGVACARVENAHLIRRLGKRTQAALVQRARVHLRWRMYLPTVSHVRTHFTHTLSRRYAHTASQVQLSGLCALRGVRHVCVRREYWGAEEMAYRSNCVRSRLCTTEVLLRGP